MLTENNLSLIKLTYKNETILHLNFYYNMMKWYHDKHGITVEELFTIEPTKRVTRDHLKELRNYIVDEMNANSPSTVITPDSVFIEQHTAFSTFHVAKESQIIELMGTPRSEYKGFPDTWVTINEDGNKVSKPKRNRMMAVANWKMTKGFADKSGQPTEVNEPSPVVAPVDNSKEAISAYEKAFLAELSRLTNVFGIEVTPPMTEAIKQSISNARSATNPS
ncbi:hypothetical protein [Vibrio mediterranei]|uniref:hypothetical protein n=1 Tax=Vibrio mediterranei TaxID=689 RepID=UPI0022851245|nr:hypothetical protein [Vibrio mediterranei]MCY9855894.1 hypothetical protein [Vibrio mediterranei]